MVARIQGFQKFSRAYDAYSLKRVEHQQVFVAGHDIVCFTCHCRFKHHIILGISADFNAPFRNYQEAAQEKQGYYRCNIAFRQVIFETDAR